jgi:hypothetical protein
VAAIAKPAAQFSLFLCDVIADRQTDQFLIVLPLAQNAKKLCEFSKFNDTP